MRRRGAGKKSKEIRATKKKRKIDGPDDGKQMEKEERAIKNREEKMTGK